MIPASRSFLREPEKIRASDMIVVAYFAMTHAGEETHSVIRVGLGYVAETIGFLAIDPRQRTAGAKYIP
jgi:hypothetical protein